MQFARFVLGLKKHWATAVATKTALAGILWRAKPAQSVLWVVNLYLRCVKSHPSDEGRTVGALATGAVAMHDPFNRKFGAKAHRAAQAVSVCGRAHHAFRDLCLNQAGDVIENLCAVGFVQDFVTGLRVFDLRGGQAEFLQTRQ